MRLPLTELPPKQNVRTWEHVLTEIPNVVPVSLRDKFKAELNLLMKQGIILPVIKPTSWVNSFVWKMNGSVSLCLDANDKYFVTSTFEDIVSWLHGAKWFTIVDVKSRYWQLNL